MNQGAIGVLDRTQMDHFASIFVDYQKRGKAEDEEGIVHPRQHVELLYNVPPFREASIRRAAPALDWSTCPRQEAGFRWTGSFFRQVCEVNVH